MARNSGRSVRTLKSLSICWQSVGCLLEFPVMCVFSFMPPPRRTLFDSFRGHAYCDGYRTVMGCTGGSKIEWNQRLLYITVLCLYTTRSLRLHPTSMTETWQNCQCSSVCSYCRTRGIKDRFPKGKTIPLLDPHFLSPSSGARGGGNGEPEKRTNDKTRGDCVQFWDLARQ